MLFRNRLFSMIVALFLVFALVSPSAAVACTGSGRLYDGQKSPAASIRHEDGTAGHAGGTTVEERGSGRELKRGPERESGNQSGQKHETKTDPAKRLPVLSTEPAAGASGVRPDTAIRIVFDPASKMFKYISKQLQKNHFFVLLNGRKAEAVYDGKNTVEVKPGLLQRYTGYTVRFCLHPYNFLTKAIDAVNRKLGLHWDRKTYEFAFKTGSALHEPRHAEFALSSNRAKVTEGAVLGVTFTDDYGQPGYGASGKVTLVESGQKPGSAKAAPSEFTVAENSDGTAEVAISDTEAEKITVAVEVYGPYPEDAAKFSGEVDFRPGPAAKVSLSCDKKQVVAGQKAAVSGTAEDAYGNPVEDGTQVVASASAGQVSGASTSGGAFSLEFTAPTKKQPVTLTAEVDGCRASLDVPVIADVPAKVTVTPEKEKAMAGSPVRVGILVEDRYGNPVEDGTAVTVTAEGGSASPSEVTTKEGAASVEVTSGRAGEVTVTASAQNGVTGSAAVSFVPVVPSGSRVSLEAKPGGVPGEYVIEGQVTKDGAPVPSVAVPLTAGNGELSDSAPVTDQQGSFSVALKKADSPGCVTVAVDTSRAPGVAAGTVGIDPLIYGSQPWTDTGIDVGAGLLIRVEAVGSWASELYAKIGDSGTPVKVGANGGFVTGVAGRLYLGPNAATYADDVETVIYIDSPAAVGILPTLSLTADPAQISADGKSTSALSGRVMYGQYPGVGVTVNLSATLGTVSPASPVTGADGSYQAVFTAGTQGGTAAVTATYGNLTQKAQITLTGSTAPVPSYVQTWTKGIKYSYDGQTWTYVSLGNDVDKVYGLVYDPTLKEYFVVLDGWVYGNIDRYLYGYVYSSSDGIHWSKCFSTINQLYAIATNGKGTIVVGGGYQKIGIETHIYTSTGGKAWTETAQGYRSPYGWYTGIAIGIVRDLTYTGTMFLAGSVKSPPYAYSADGYKWIKSS